MSARKVTRNTTAALVLFILATVLIVGQFFFRFHLSPAPTSSISATTPTAETLEHILYNGVGNDTNQDDDIEGYRVSESSQQSPLEIFTIYIMNTFQVYMSTNYGTYYCDLNVGHYQRLGPDRPSSNMLDRHLSGPLFIWIKCTFPDTEYGMPNVYHLFHDADAGIGK